MKREREREGGGREEKERGEKREERVIEGKRDMYRQR